MTSTPQRQVSSRARLLTCVAILALSACSSTPTADVRRDGSEPKATTDTRTAGEGLRDFTVSLIELIARPRDFDGRRIMVHGTLALGFEHMALYLHREDYEGGVTANSVWVNVPSDVYESRSKYNGRAVAVVGTFNANAHGHGGMFIG